MKTNHIVSLIATIRDKANQFIINEMSQRGIKQLAPSHGDILVALFKKEPLSMKELAEKIERDKSTVTTLIDKLIDLGYVVKQRDAVDSRVILVFLTKKGRELQSDFDEISSILLSTVFQGIEENDQETLIRTLSKIKDNF